MPDQALSMVSMAIRPPLGLLRTSQVPIRDVARLTGLDLARLSAGDRMPVAAAHPLAKLTPIRREVAGPECLAWTSTSMARGTTRTVGETTQ